MLLDVLEVVAVGLVPLDAFDLTLSSSKLKLLIFELLCNDNDPFFNTIFKMLQHY